MDNVITAKGYLGSITFDGKFVTVISTSRVAGKGAKRVPLSAIVAIEVKPAGFGTRGFLRIETAGQQGRVYRSAQKRTKAAFENENAVLFNRKTQADFLALRDAIEDALI